MKTIRWSSTFKSNYKRVKRSSRYRDALSILTMVTNALTKEELLPPTLRGRYLIGSWSGCKECHLAPDLLLIYRYEGESAVAFLRLGTHSELFG